MEVFLRGSRTSSRHIIQRDVATRSYGSRCSASCTRINNLSAFQTANNLTGATATSSSSSGVHRSSASISGQSIRSFSRLSWHDEIDSSCLTERQEGFLLERISPDLTETDIATILENEGIKADQILLMKSRLGRSQGRALILCTEPKGHVCKLFPNANACSSGGSQNLSEQKVTYRPQDAHDVRLFVEQAEAYVRFSDDLHKLSRKENFLRVATINNVPRAYGRKDVAYILKKECKIDVPPSNIIFNFKRFGVQSDVCFVICKSRQECDAVINKVQELAVPRHCKYETFFGCSFLYADRSSMFMQNERFDFNTEKFQIFTSGWAGNMTEKVFTDFLNKLKFFPSKVRKAQVNEDGTSSFICDLPNMKFTKQMLMRMRRMKRRWRVPQNRVVYAYPRLVDVHWGHEDRYRDEQELDDDIDEPVHY